MPETIEKLRPDRDLQCYYFDESAIAALSETSPDGFVVSGTWRQQFDWCVIEWNRDNVFEHPAFRTLPDGDLSGLTLTYEETRENCIPLDSDLSPTVDWPYLRVWAGDNGDEKVYFVPLKNHAEGIEGIRETAYADFTLSGLITADGWIGLSYTSGNFPGQDFAVEVHDGDPLTSVLDQIVAGMTEREDPFGNPIRPVVRAERIGETIRVYYTGTAHDLDSATTGTNGNRFGMFAYASGGATWDSPGKTFSNGTSFTRWRITIDFSTLKGWRKDDSGFFILDEDRNPVEFDVPRTQIRKLRWTYSADQQLGEFERSEFKVTVSNWTVTGTGREYSIAGPGSRRIEDNDSKAIYTGTWGFDQGNYSGGTIRYSEEIGNAVSVRYVASSTHELYVGTRYLGNGATASFTVDGASVGSVNLLIPAEDVLIRWRIGTYGPGSHVFTMMQTSAGRLDFDFVEMAMPTSELPTFPDIPGITLATDWDTLHSVAIAPERTAWMIRSLGFTGRQNHYVGALLFYEMHNLGNRYASGSFTFSGTPVAGTIIKITVGPWDGLIGVERKIMEGETIETVILSFQQEFSKGYSTLWAEKHGNVLTIHARQQGNAGEALQLAAYSSNPAFTITPSGLAFEGGEDGEWHTDLGATPRLNRAMRDWTRSFLTALHGYGIDAACAFSTELKHGDRSPEAGIAQRDVDNNAIYLPTPAIQTNFSTTSLAYWEQVHADCAQIMAEAGLTPYLQFGEEQWWYFPHDGTLNGETFASMPFYDEWTKSEFEARYGRPMAVFRDNDANPAEYPEEVEFLSGLLGNFTTAIMDHVRAEHPEARFEVLYPFDVNDTAFNRAINFPDAAWTPATLTSLKTEGLRYTFGKNLRASERDLAMGEPLGFGPMQRSHLTGLGDYSAPWLKEARIALGKGFENVVLFALDQFCLIGYKLPLTRGGRRTVRVRH